MLKPRDVPKWPLGRYRLTEKAYMGRTPGAQHEPLDIGAEVVWDGLPGPHMEPIDAQARANVEHATKTHGAQTLDPTSELSLIVGEVDDVETAIEHAQAQVEALKARRVATQMQGHSSRVKPPAPLSGAQAAADTAVPPVPPLAALPGLPPPMAAPPPPPR